MQEFEDKFGKVQVFETNDQFGASILLIGPGREIKKHYHKEMIEMEVILEGEVMYGDRLQKKGDINIWRTNIPHGYKNNTDSVVKILCISIPPYNPEDVFEI